MEKNKLDPIKDTAFLIDHWSYSSMAKFLNNRLAFKKRYILKINDKTYSPSAVLGQACHEAAKHILLGSTIDKATEQGVKKIYERDPEIDYGKTGSLEKLLKDFNQAFGFYLKERPQYKKILAVETPETAFIEIAGNKMSIPAKNITDVVYMEGKDICIDDHKFTSSFSDEYAEKGTYFLQSMFSYHVIKAIFGKAPKRMRFSEYKVSKNKDGTTQRQDYTINFDDVPHYFTVFYQLYKDCTEEIARPDIKFFPNFNDMFDGDQTFLDYTQNLIDMDAPRIVKHKNAPVIIMEHKFIESQATSVDNNYLPPEEKIRLKLQEFGLPVEMNTTYSGSSVILYTMKPGRGCKMSVFKQHAKDLALALEAKTIRIQAPIMGTSLVGIEVPSKDKVLVPLFDGEGLLPKMPADGRLNLPIGINVYGDIVSKAIEDMPHLLVAGATGSGKSVMLNGIIHTLKEYPKEKVGLILIDPKRVEFTQFKNIPNLLCPVITNDKKASAALKWLVDEMENRYSILENANVRNIDEYNRTGEMQKIVVIIDEYADLVLQKEFMAEEDIVRLAQKSRAVGIHLIIGTQRPSVDIVTGRIKANIPTRISFMTSSGIDSKIILDEYGAEELIGKGDMLFLDPNVKGLVRLQGFFC